MYIYIYIYRERERDTTAPGPVVDDGERRGLPREPHGEEPEGPGAIPRVIRQIPTLT